MAQRLWHTISNCAQFCFDSVYTNHQTISRKNIATQDEIYVNPNTIAGSIGVVNSGFGFNKLRDKIGVERRVITAGTNKARMDPYKPLKDMDKQKMERVLAEVHKNLVTDVKAGRGKRLKGSPEQFFSGDFWTGEVAVNLGLVDGLGSFETILRKVGVK